MKREQVALIQRWSSSALATLFAVVICLPLVGFVLESTAGREGEDLKGNELPAPPPRFDQDRPFDFLYDSVGFFEQNFAFRPFLVQLRNLPRSRVPGLQVGDVLAGHEGWFYVTVNQTIEDYRGLIRIPDRELLAIKERLETRKAILEEMGIRYLVVFAPTKWEVYPEYMPERISRVSPDSTLNQVSRFLENETEIDYLDLRESLLAGKARLKVFQKNDTHWGQGGAFTAVQAINRRLGEWFPAVEVESLVDLHIELERVSGGDLAAMMGLSEYLSEERSRLTRRRSGRVFERRRERDETLRFRRLEPNGTGLSVVVFHDSFGRSFWKFLPNSFDEGVFFSKTGFDLDAVIREQPDIVIHEIGQRRLTARLLSD